MPRLTAAADVDLGPDDDGTIEAALAAHRAATTDDERAAADRALEVRLARFRAALGVIARASRRPGASTARIPRRPT